MLLPTDKELVLCFARVYSRTNSTLFLLFYQKTNCIILFKCDVMLENPAYGGANIFFPYVCTQRLFLKCALSGQSVLCINYAPLVACYFYPSTIRVILANQVCRIIVSFIVDVIFISLEIGGLHLRKSAFRLRKYIPAFARKKVFICAKNLTINCAKDFKNSVLLPLANVKEILATYSPRGVGSRIFSKIMFVLDS